MWRAEVFAGNFQELEIFLLVEKFSCRLINQLKSHSLVQLEKYSRNAMSRHDSNCFCRRALIFVSFYALQLQQQKINKFNECTKRLRDFHEWSIARYFYE